MLAAGPAPRAAASMLVSFPEHPQETQLPITPLPRLPVGLQPAPCYGLLPAPRTPRPIPDSLLLLGPMPGLPGPCRGGLGLSLPAWARPSLAPCTVQLASGNGLVSSPGGRASVPHHFPHLGTLLIIPLLRLPGPPCPAACHVWSQDSEPEPPTAGRCGRELS